MRAAALALLLILPVLPLTGLAAQAAGYPDGMPGAEVGRLVRSALTDAGVAAEVTDPIRPYPACNTVPVVTPRDGGWTNAEVTCSAPHWVRIFRTGTGPAPRMAKPEAPKPLEMRAVVLKHSLSRGTQIASEDLELAPVSAVGPDQIFSDPTEVVGRRLKLSLGEGKPVLVRHLEPRWLVQPGAPLVLMAMAGNLAVSAPAEALDAGAEGDVVRVVNLSSGREVKAIVTGQNTVMAQTNMR